MDLRACSSTQWETEVAADVERRSVNEAWAEGARLRPPRVWPSCTSMVFFSVLFERARRALGAARGASLEERERGSRTAPPPWQGPGPCFLPVQKKTACPALQVSPPTRRPRRSKALAGETQSLQNRLRVTLGARALARGAAKVDRGHGDRDQRRRVRRSGGDDHVWCSRGRQ